MPSRVVITMKNYKYFVRYIIILLSRIRAHCSYVSCAVVLTFSGCYQLSDLHLCACAINVKSSMCSETTKHFLYKCHGLFVNSPVMTTVYSCLKFRLIGPLIGKWVTIHGETPRDWTWLGTGHKIQE